MLSSKEEILVIEPSRGWRSINLKEIWSYRELLYFFTWRDLKVRYKQTVIGVLWALIQPFLTMVVFSIFFGKLVKVPSEGIPYPVFVYAGLLPWTLFSQSLSRASESLVSQSNLIQKVYFPRLINPVAASLSALVDFLVSLVILFLMMMYYQIPINTHLLFVPILIVIIFLCSLGVGLWLSALNVLYRDVRYIIPFILQLGMFVTPVIYPVSIVPEKYMWIFYLNPMAGMIEGFRYLLLGGNALSMEGMGISLITTGVFFVSGLFFFRRMERKFADVI